MPTSRYLEGSRFERNVGGEPSCAIHSANASGTVEEWIMKKTLLLLGILASVSLGAAEKPRVAICGLAIESSTFSPALTDEAAFHASTGQAILDTYPFFSGVHSLRNRAVWFGAVQGHALPGGAVTRDAYESLMRKTLDALREQLPLDGLFFDIHGAMSVVGMEDAEGGHDLEDTDAGGTQDPHLHVDGPARKRVVATGRAIRPDHLLPHGTARGRDAIQAAGCREPAHPARE